MSFPYVNVPSKLKDFMQEVRKIGVPDKTTFSWLESLGYKSSNDRSILKILPFIGFTDDSGKPTDTWLSYRGADHKKVLASAIIEGYSDLYKTYPDAHTRDETTLDSFFSTKSTAGKQVISRTVKTFAILCELADFDGIQSTSPHPPVKQSKPQGIVSKPIESQKTRTDVAVTSNPPATGQDKPSLHIDIQIHISPDASADQIDQIFASMAKHLYKN